MIIQPQGQSDQSLFCQVCHVPWDEDNEGCYVCKPIRNLKRSRNDVVIKNSKGEIEWIPTNGVPLSPPEYL